MVSRYFQGNDTHPQHVSVGGIVSNDKGEVCVHHFGDMSPYENYFSEHGLSNFYILMRETVLPNEPLETALARGFMEELGMTAELTDYVGALTVEYDLRGVAVQKTTLYFTCTLVSQNDSLRKGEESTSAIEWHPIDFLIPKMQEQGKRLGRADFDESEILLRLKR